MDNYSAHGSNEAKISKRFNSKFIQSSIGYKSGDHMAVTVKQMIAWGPHPNYSRERIEKLFAGRERLSAYDIANLKIYPWDIVWMLRHREFLTDEQISLFECDSSDDIAFSKLEHWSQGDLRWFVGRNRAYRRLIAAMLDAVDETMMSRERE